MKNPYISEKEDGSNKYGKIKVIPEIDYFRKRAKLAEAAFGDGEAAKDAFFKWQHFVTHHAVIGERSRL